MPAATAAADIRAILEISRRHNQREALTGALLATAGCFAQVLEGPEAAVVRRFASIRRDTRHGEVTVLDFAAAPARLFAGWPMGYNGALAEQTGRAAAVLAQAFADPAGCAAALLALITQAMQRDAEWAEPILPAKPPVIRDLADYAAALSGAD